MKPLTSKFAAYPRPRSVFPPGDQPYAQTTLEGAVDQIPEKVRNTSPNWVVLGCSKTITGMMLSTRSAWTGRKRMVSALSTPVH